MDTALLVLACVGQFIILCFAWIGVKLTYKAWKFAAELQLTEYRYRKNKELRDKQVADAKAEQKK